MKQKKIGLLLLLFALFVIANSAVYYVSEINKNERIQIALDDNLNELETHYKILLFNQAIAADAVYTSTTTMFEGLNPILRAAQTASPEEKTILRQKLYQLLKKKYEIVKTKGVLQYHFVLPNNESFLRMHKPSKFGDNLTDIRKDFHYTNRTKKPVKGFTQGRTAHGFRNTYPLFDVDGTHLGAMEVSFSSDDFQKYLTNISNIHTHFLVNKHIFDAKAWKRDDLIVAYTQSAEHKDFMLTVNRLHSKQLCITENKSNFQDKQDEINKGILKEHSFSVYTHLADNSVVVASYFPIKNLEKTKALAWLVSYEDSPFIHSTIHNIRIWRLGFFILFLVLIYLIYILVLTKNRVEKEHKLLNDVLNATDDIMFMTNFTRVTFSNRKFREFFDVNSADEFHEKHDKLLELLIQKDGYLHQGLISQDITFAQLIEHTPEDERVILIFDKHLNAKSFNITLSKTTDNHHNSYLVTLTDITKLKEKEFTIQKKAYTDGLTGVYNRNKFDEVVKQEFQRSARYRRNLSVAIIDIDHFKNFNDTYGHLIGDEVLIMLAHFLNTNVRETDIFARWGGEEFVILFPETPKEEVKRICEKLRIGIEMLVHKTAGNVTASFGVTQYEEKDSVNSMFQRCDEALYMAKECGRNIVCVK